MKNLQIVCGTTLLATLFAGASAFAAGDTVSGQSSQSQYPSAGATSSTQSANDAASADTGMQSNNGLSSGSSGTAGATSSGGSGTAGQTASGQGSQYSGTAASSGMQSGGNANLSSGGTGQSSSSNQYSGSGAQSGSQSSGASGTQTSSSASGGQQGQGMQHPPVVYVLVPVEAANGNSAMQNGCWARVFGGKNYSGDMLTLNGPFDLPRMVGPFGINWKNKVHSIEVGKSATVTVYDNENFKDQVTQFKPGAKVADVSKRMGFFDDFSSMKITCGQ